MTFADVLMEAAHHREFVEQYDRLSGTNLSRCGTGIDLTIDDASGRMDAEVPAFVAFVYECIWLRLPLEARGSQPIDDGS